MKDFKKGKTYTCASTCGAYPVFVPEGCENAEDEKIYLSHKDQGKPVLIRDEDETLNYHRDFNSFLPEKPYLCVSEDPLILKGPSTRTHKTEGTDWMDYTAGMLSGIMANMDGAGMPVPVLKLVLSCMKWQIINHWDHTVQGLKDLITERLTDCLTAYRGSSHGYASWQKERMLFFAVFLSTEDAEILEKAGPDILPPVSVTWKGTKRPEIRFENGQTAREWVWSLLKPDVPVPDENNESEV